jgi:hypothetical protein
MRTNSLFRKGLPVIVVVLLIGTAIYVMAEPLDPSLIKTKATIGLQGFSRDQVELRYYDPNTLIGVMGGPSGSPQTWRTAIRLTQTELDPYNTWNLTKVVIGFGEDSNEGPVNVTIIIYDNGTPTNPGVIIVDDTNAILNGTRLITVPLVTPVALAGHTELWVCVQWIQKQVMTHYAFFDAGPAVRGKGDWIYINSGWSELYQWWDDYNWAIGAIVEGQWSTTLTLGNITKVPFGFDTEVQNTGDVDALNVTWSFTVLGGILGHHKTATGTDATLIAHGTLPISVHLFIVFGKIAIAIDAQATNAAEVSVRKSAFLLGPFLFGIK